MNIREALSQLDSMEDEHWTTDGAPKVEAVSELVGEKVSRQDIIDTAPHFSRENMELEGGDDDGKPQSAPGTTDGPTPPASEVTEDEGQDDAVVNFLKEYAEGEILTEIDFVAVMNKAPKEALQALQEIVHDQSNEAVNAVKKAQQMKADLDKAVMHIDARVAKTFPDMSDQEATMHYIKSQNQARAEAHERKKAILQGLSLADIDPRAPIDRAFARKNARGAARPSRPNMNR